MCARNANCWRELCRRCLASNNFCDVPIVKTRDSKQKCVDSLALQFSIKKQWKTVPKLWDLCVLNVWKKCNYYKLRIEAVF